MLFRNTNGEMGIPDDRCGAKIDRSSARNVIAPASVPAVPRKGMVMSMELLLPTRRKILAGSAWLGAAGLLSAHLASATGAPPGPAANEAASEMGKVEDNAIRPSVSKRPMRR